MKNILRNLDITSILSGIFGVAVATQIKEWLSIILTAISVISILISSTLRIIDKVKQAKSKDSDGGEKITSEEMKEIVSEGKKEIDEATKKIEEEINEDERD